jgi:hypothetical protein
MILQAHALRETARCRGGDGIEPSGAPVSRDHDLPGWLLSLDGCHVLHDISAA